MAAHHQNQRAGGLGLMSGASTHGSVNPPLAAIYCRLSEEDKDKQNPQADSRSIQNQKSLLVHHAVEQGWGIYQIYSDDDYTGSDRDRPQFTQLLKDANQGKFQIILCKSQSRFTREMELVEKYIHGLFTQWNIRFIGLADNADTANKGNKKARQINGLVNEWYLEDLSENIRTVLDNKRREGQFIGSFASYGYQKDAQDKHHLMPDEATAPNVRRIYTLYLQGYGPAKIAAIFNQEGIPNPSATKKQNNPNFNRGHTTLTGTQWSAATVTDILKKEVYIGNTVQHINQKISYKSKIMRRIPHEQHVVVPNTHEALIDSDTWLATRAALRERGVEQRAQGVRDVLAGKCRCALCCGGMRTQYGGNVQRKYFICTAHSVNPKLCAGTRIQRELLAEELLSKIRQNVQTYLDEQYLSANLQLVDAAAASEKRLQKQSAELANQREHQKKYLKSIYIDKVKGLLTDAQFADFSADFHSEIIALETKIAQNSAQLKSLEVEKQTPIPVEQLIRKYAKVEALTHPIVQELVDCILIGRPEKQRQPVPIEIKWNF